VWWAGAGAGGVIVNDSWSVLADREPPEDVAFVGPRTTTIGTEGVTVGAGAGGDWTFADNWSAGLTLRYMNWFFPGEPAFSPTGDVASLSGRVDTFELSLLMAYRIAL
jgi:opacity protein-like surface antigen